MSETDALQDIDLVLIQFGTIKQTPQTQQQRPRMIRVQEAGHLQDFPQVAMKVFQLGAGGQTRLRRLPGQLRRCGHAQLVTDHLHRHGQIQGAVVGVGRNLHQLLTARQVLVIQPRLLRPEDHGHPATMGFPQR
jgi:hypothetical protein